MLNGRDVAKLSAAKDTLYNQGITADILAFDATDHATVRSAIDAFEADVGAIDILVNNAGMQHRAPLEDFPPDAFERLLQTNIAGCAIFASVSGSSIATAASIGGVALPQLIRRRYNRALAAGSLAAGGTLGILIPPSFPMII